MTALRHRLKSYVWVALVAMCGLSIGPSISRALVADGARAAVVHAHCMEMGAAEQMAAGLHGLAAERPGAPAHHRHDALDCCALCAVAAAPFSGVAIVVAQWAPADNSRAPVFDRASAPPLPRELFPTAAPRGPPLRS